MVGVLIFINQNVPELALVFSGHCRKSAQQVHGFANQVVEVKSVVALQFALVARENFGNHALHWVGHVGISSITFGIVQLIFGIRNHRRNTSRGQLMNVGTHLANQSL